MSNLIPNNNDFILYTAPNGDIKIQVVLSDETIWLTQKAISELFTVGVPAISKHLSNIFESGELIETAVVSILETTAADGKKYKTKYYNLDAIISIGYRVNSTKATQFRIWATNTLKEYIIKNFGIIGFARLAKWHEKANQPGLKSFNILSRTINNHYQNILNYFDDRSTNAPAESFNAKIKTFRTQFRGVRNIEFFLLRLTTIYT